MGQPYFHNKKYACPRLLTNRILTVVGTRKGQINTGDIDRYIDFKEWIYSDSFWNPLQIKPDYIATAPYFGNDMDGNAGNIRDLLLTDIERQVAQATRFSQRLKERNLPYKLVFYETGQHVTQNCAALNRGETMGEAYRLYFQGGTATFRRGGSGNAEQVSIAGLDAVPDLDLMALFTHAGGYQDSSTNPLAQCWGTKENSGKRDIPKFNAFKNWIDAR